MYTGNTLGPNGAAGSSANFKLSFPRKAIIGVILVVALFAFEIFNFDTTRYALESLLGETSFLGIHWAAILAIAFCAIDFAGLARLFTPDAGASESRAAWYLMGAWLLGATMNAVMTWWAVNLTLLNHDLGNEVLSRGQLLRFVPLFVAVLVWLTRILFIGAFSLAGEHLFDTAADAPAVARKAAAERAARLPQGAPQRSSIPAAPQPMAAAPARPVSSPQRPSPTNPTRPVPLGMQARGRSR
jgi:hypothetical protein